MCVRKKDKKKEAENKPALASLPAFASLRPCESRLKKCLRVSAYLASLYSVSPSDHSPFSKVKCISL